MESSSDNFIESDAVETGVDLHNSLKENTDMNNPRELNCDLSLQNFEDFSDNESSGSIYIPSIASDSLTSSDDEESLDVGEARRKIKELKNIEIGQPSSSKVSFMFYLFKRLSKMFT